MSQKDELCTLNSIVKYSTRLLFPSWPPVSLSAPRESDRYRSTFAILFLLVPRLRLQKTARPSVSPTESIFDSPAPTQRMGGCPENPDGHEKAKSENTCVSKYACERVDSTICTAFEGENIRLRRAE